MKQLLFFLGLLLALTAKSAVVVPPISGYPNTNNLPGNAMFVVAITNASIRTNYNFRYDDLILRLSNAVPVIVINTNSTIVISNNFGSEGIWMIRNGFASITNGATNSIKISTNGYGLLIGDTNTANRMEAWPRTGLKLLIAQDGSTGHTPTEFKVEEYDGSTNGSELSVVTRSSTSPQLVTTGLVKTNGVEASDYIFLLQKTGGYLVIQDQSSSNMVGFQNGGQLSSAIGPNHIRVFSHGGEKMILSTNGDASFFRNFTNYGNTVLKSNLAVSGATLLNGTLIGGDAALFLKSVGVTEGVYTIGLTNTGGFQSLGLIRLGNNSSDLTTSSNTFRSYGPTHIHSSLFMQDIGVAANKIMYLTAGRQVSTVSTVDPTELSYLDGVTGPIQVQIDAISASTTAYETLTNGVRVGIGTNVNWTTGVTGYVSGSTLNLGVNVSGGGGSSQWIDDASVFHPIAGATNFVGGGNSNSIFANAIFSTIAGGNQNTNATNSSFSFIGGGHKNRIVHSDFATLSGGFRNTMSTNSSYSVIGGGRDNQVKASIYSTVSGGWGNIIDTNSPNSFIGGGQDNNIRTNVNAGTIGGGALHEIFGGSDFGTIAGGYINTIAANSYFSFIGGGAVNTINPDSIDATIGGGTLNTIGASSPDSTVGGGYNNHANGERSTVSGGRQNTVSAPYSFIPGGFGNTVSSTGTNSAALGANLTVTAHHATEIGYLGTRKTRFDTNAVTMIGLGTLYASNQVAQVALPTASQIGVGGFHVANSNGTLVALYSLNGTTTIMDTLSPAAGGGGGGGGGGSSASTNTESAFGWYNVRTTPFLAVGNGVADDTAALELAIATAKTNAPGVVMLPAGTYLIKRPLFLPSNVSLRGSGYSTRITKPTSVRVTLTNGSLYSAGGFSVSLPDTNGFEVGGSIHLADTDSYTWLATQATITNITGSVVTFNRPLDGSLQTNRGAFATTSFPLIRNEVDRTTNIMIRDLVLDHNGSTNDPSDDFTLGTIHYEGNFGGVVDNVWLLNAASDAYSDQATNGLGIVTPATNYIRRTANIIRGSHINNARGHGVHLGTCMEGALVQGNDIRNCAGFAEFYCAFVTYTVSSGNLVDHCLSGFAGIDYRDYGNVISGNVIRNCTNYSIDLISSGGDGTGGKVTIANNSIYGVGIGLNQPDCIISGNTIEALTGGVTGISMGVLADRTMISGNFITAAGSGSQCISMQYDDDCRLIGNNLSDAETHVYVLGCSRLVASGNFLGTAYAYSWRFTGAASTNCVIKDERNLSGTPVVENVAAVRLVYEGYGDNGTNNPAVAGDWNGITGKMFNGVSVVWTNLTTTNISMFVNGAWRSTASAEAFSVSTNLFVLGTRMTNGMRRIFVGASAQLSAAAAGTAKVTLYVENAGSATNRLSVSAGPLASLITVEALFMAVSPGSIYYFTDETSGVGAAAALLPETCSVTAF